MKRAFQSTSVMLRLASATFALIVCAGAAAVLSGRADPDPGQLVFIRRAGFDASIYVLDSLHMTERTLFTVPAALPADLPKLAPGGQRIAFELWGEGGLAIQALDSDLRTLYLTEPTLQDRLPAWSPDGAQIGFWSNRTSPSPRRSRWQNWNFFLYDVTTQHMHALTELHNVLPFNLPMWSPDGRYILLNYWRPGVGAGTSVIETRTGNAQSIDDVIASGSELAWSPDGQRIAFRANPGGNTEVVVLDMRTRTVINLSNHPARDFEPVWSPDGTQIAFTSTRDGRGEIYVMNADGSQPRRVTHGGGWRALWSSDGAQIAFISDRTGDTAYHVIDVDGTDSRFLAPTDQQNLLGWLTHP
jgi:Tol biopolymer transport system component